MSPAPLAAAGAAGAPLRPDAEAARQLAEQELSRQVYRSAEPGLVERALDAFLDALDAIDPTAGGSAGQAVAVLVLLVVLVVVGVLAVRATGRSGSAPDRGRAVLAGAPTSAAELRSRADAAAAREDWRAAVTERFRAVVRSLQERDLLPGAPGLTAAEAAARAGGQLPEHAAALADAARRFDAVAYGGDPAGPEDDARSRELDAAVARTRPTPGGSRAGTPAGAVAGG